MLVKPFYLNCIEFYCRAKQGWKSKCRCIFYGREGVRLEKITAYSCILVAVRGWIWFTAIAISSFLICSLPSCKERFKIKFFPWKPLVCILDPSHRWCRKDAILCLQVNANMPESSRDRASYTHSLHNFATCEFWNIFTIFGMRLSRYWFSVDGARTLYHRPLYHKHFITRPLYHAATLSLGHFITQTFEHKNRTF